MGYKYLYRPNHPNANKNGQIKRCRFIMYEHIGRPLLKTEIVHHINGDKSDDRIENLIILTRKEHTSHHVSGNNNTNYTNFRMKICPQCQKEIIRTNDNNFVRNTCCSKECRAAYYKKERGCNTKITQQIADKIKTLKGLIGSRKIALIFEISPTQVKRILRGDVWV